MLTTIVLVLVAIAVVALVAWWWADFDMPEVAVPAAAPGIGAGIIYWYGTPLAWAIGIALLLAAAGYLVWRLAGKRARRDREPPK